MRRIPATMATQHPDNATAPYWDSEHPFIGVHEEITEAVSCFKDLDVDEYMWDWEGKHADAAVIDRLFSDYYDYFSTKQLGRDKFLTFRIPNIWEEKGYNLMQAMSVILSSEDFARDLKFDTRPLFEIILPMTERADQVIHMQKLFEKLAKFKSSEFTADHDTNNTYIELIPLVESVESQLAVGDLLTEYVTLHETHFGHKPKYIRPFLAGSDSALSSGFLAGIIGNKIALSRLYEFADKSGIPVYPIIGTGGLRFRGGLAPNTIDRFIQEFPGVRTATVQSAFRYDYSLTEVKAAIVKLKQELPKVQPRIIKAAHQASLIAIAQTSAEFYKQTLNQIAVDVGRFFKAMPKRRDRRQHIGLLAYARSSGDVTLPRAITFTGGFYSIGVPPELIGLGRALAELSPADLAMLKEEYPNLAKDIEAAGYYFNADNLDTLSATNKAWDEVKADIAAIEKVLKIKLGPSSKDEATHKELSSKALATQDSTALNELITQMAELRKSIG